MVICFLGDSLTLGFGDAENLGWAGRMAARLIYDGTGITAYNLGVRKDTSVLLNRRWQAEVEPRKLDGVPFKLVISFGVADILNGVQTEDSLAAAFAMLTQAREAGDVLVVGPTPVSDAAKSEEIALLSVLIETMCRQLDIPFIATIDAMSRSAVYAQALADGDTVHPTGAGYAELADHIDETNEARRFFGLE